MKHFNIFNIFIFITLMNLIAFIFSSLAQIQNIILPMWTVLDRMQGLSRPMANKPDTITESRKASLNTVRPPTRMEASLFLSLALAVSLVLVSKLQSTNSSHMLLELNVFKYYVKINVKILKKCMEVYHALNIQNSNVQYMKFWDP